MRFQRLQTSIRMSSADIWKIVASIPRGVDLEGRGREVAKIFYAHFAQQVIREGYDPDDVLQDIYQGLIMRNRGKNPYNPDVSKFGHYVHLVCKSVWINYRQKYGRHRSKLVPFYGRSSMGEDYGDQDPGSADISVDSGEGVSQILMTIGSLPAPEREILSSLANGESRIDIQRKGYTRAAIDAAMDLARSIL